MNHPPITRDSIRFYEEGRYIRFDRSKDKRVDSFGFWMTDDVQGSSFYLAEIVDAVALHLTDPNAEPFEFSGNAWFGTIADKVELACHFNDTEVTLSLAEAAVLLHEYWKRARAWNGAARFAEGLTMFRTEHGRDPVLPWEDEDEA